MTKKRAKKPINKVDHPLDVALGARIRALRVKANVSQIWVARECGITHAQVQKYERGVNGVRFSRLVEISRTLNVSVFDLISPVLPEA